MITGAAQMDGLRINGFSEAIVSYIQAWEAQK